jgi:chorismate synthase
MTWKKWEEGSVEMSNSIGRELVLTSFGESHGAVIGAVLDGCPAGLSLTAADIQHDLDRRRSPGKTGATARQEKDRVEILSGLYNGLTTGAPLCMMIRNEDVNDADYEKIAAKIRPGHADYTAFVKYGGLNDARGGGRFSGRITAAFVMGGVVAKKLLAKIGAEIFAYTVEIGGIKAKTVDFKDIKKLAAKDPLGCADAAASQKMQALILKTQKAGDSLGGIIEGVALNVPAGLGEPVFGGVEGELGKALFSIPAVKGVEFGAGFKVAQLRGSENNDAFIIKNGKIITKTNNAGGILGGITNGMPIVVRIAVKPTASIALGQDTVNIKTMKNTTITVGGRHDVCVVPRAVPVVEAMMALTLADLALRAGKIPGVLK